MTAIERYLQKEFKFDASYFLRGGFWATAGQVVGIFGGLITSVLFAHFLLPEEYGIYKYLITIAVILSSFSLTGIGQSVLQSVAKGNLSFYMRAPSIGWLYSIGLIIIALFGAGYYYLHDNHILALGLLLIALLQPVINIYGIYPALLQGQKKFRENTYFFTIKTIFLTLVSIATILITKNILILFFVYLASNASINLILYYLTRPQSTQTDTQTTEYTRYLSYAKHTSVRNVIASIANRLDSIILFQQLGAAELAIYSIANILPEQIKGSLKNVANLILPKFTQYSDIEDIKKIIPKRTVQLFFILCGITILYIVLAPIVYHTLFPKYTQAILLSQLSALAFPSYILFLPQGALQSQMYNSQLSKIIIWGSTLQIIFLLIFIPIFGILGAVISRILYRYTVMTLAFVLLFRQKPILKKRL